MGNDNKGKCEEVILFLYTEIETEPGSVLRCGLKSVTDCLYSRYCVDTEVKLIKQNKLPNFQLISRAKTHSPSP